MNWEKRIKSVNWKELKTTYKSSEEIPILLMRLTNDLNSEQLQNISTELDWRIDEYWGSFKFFGIEKHVFTFVFQILLEMLEDYSIPNRPWIFNYLSRYFIEVRDTNTIYDVTVQKIYQPKLSIFLQLVEGYADDLTFKSYVVNKLTSERYFSDEQSVLIANHIRKYISFKENIDFTILSVASLGNLFINYRDALSEYQDAYLSILPDYKEVKHKNLRLAIIYAKAVIYGNQMPESLRSILSKQLLLPNRLPLNKQKAWSTFIPDSEWLFGGSKETRLTERYTSTNWAYAAKALSQLKVEDEIEVYRSLIEEVIYPARAIQFSLTILEKVFDIKLGISLSDFHGKVEILGSVDILDLSVQ